MSEPAGVGTADDHAAKVAKKILPAKCEPRWRALVTRFIAEAITASRRQAKEEDAKIAESTPLGSGKFAEESNPYAAQHQQAARIAEAIRSSVNPPGDLVERTNTRDGNE